MHKSELGDLVMWEVVSGWAQAKSVQEAGAEPHPNAGRERLGAHKICPHVGRSAALGGRWLFYKTAATGGPAVEGGWCLSLSLLPYCLHWIPASPSSHKGLAASFSRKLLIVCFRGKKIYFFKIEDTHCSRNSKLLSVFLRMFWVY